MKRESDVQLMPGKSQRARSFLWGAIALGLVGCVTVHVNFPESAVQKAADDYVRELYEQKDGDGKKPEVKSSLETSFFEWVPSVHAAEIEFKVNTDKAKAIQKKMAGRLAKIEKNKSKGYLGETVDGMLVIRTNKKVLKKKLESLVAAENADRKALYEEILSANGMAQERMKDVKRSFSRSFQAKSSKGAWIEDAPGQWKRK